MTALKGLMAELRSLWRRAFSRGRCCSAGCGLAVVILLAAALGVILECLRGDTDVKKIEQDETERLDESCPSLVAEKPETAPDESRSRKARAKKSSAARHKVNSLPRTSASPSNPLASPPL